MAPAKRKLKPKRPNDETLSGRRSSLQVNLSFVTNLSDSGNGSLKSQMESNEVTVRRKVCQNRSDAMSNIPENDNSGSEANDKALSFMRSKEQALSQSCELLKSAILHKTREIFDQRAELVVKTTSVLKDQRKALKEINNSCGSAKMPTRSIATKKNSTQTSPSSKSILATKKSKPDTKIIQKSVERVSRGDTSVILSGSSKSHRKTLSKINDKILKVRLTRIEDPRLEISSESSQSSQSSVLDDIGAPITCSSFISSYGKSGSQVSQRAESESRKSSEDSDAEEAAVPSVQTLTPMEITAVQVPVVIPSKKSFTRLNSISSKVATCLEKTSDGSSLREVPMELTTVQSHIPFRDSAGSTNTVRTSLNVNTSANQSSCSPSKRISEEASPVRRKSSSLLSLRVNTSLRTEERSPVQQTVISDDGKTSMMKSIEKSVEDSDENNTDPMENMSLIARLRNISGKKVTEVEDRRKSDGRNRHSVGEVPSFVEGTPFPRKKTTETEASRKLNETSRSSLGSFVEGTPYPPSRSILWRTQLKSATFNTIRNRTAGKAPPVAPPKKSSKDSDSDSSTSTEYLTAPNTTVILGDSPSRFTPVTGNTQIIPDSSDEDESIEVANTSVNSAENMPKDVSKEIPKNSLKDVLKNFPMEKPAELSDDRSMETSEELPKDIPKKNTTANTTRPGKKKLFTLQENLELVSFSPLSPVITAKPPPKKTITMKRRIQKRKAARAIAAKRIESMREDDDDELVPGCSFINRVLTGKEKEKPKKPRKIISKKIVVKKIVGLDVLRELEGLGRNCSERDSTAGRDSLNDFSKTKTVPLSGRNTRSQKLVIVATGFTKGDVDLVKKIVKDLGGAEISSTVSRRTTHVVSTGVRTINLLRGIIRGCWLVSFEWVLKSLEERKWLKAEDYEMVHFSKAVQENRRDRQLFGKAYVPELFVTCGPIHIENGTTPPPAILKELVKTAGGRIAENVRDSKISVGPDGLREIWVLDSITTGDLQPIEDYQRK